MSLDPDNQITQVSVFINSNNREMSGFRFDYNTSESIEWKNYTYENSKWETRTIPEGYQIVGMFVNAEDYLSNIKLLGFNLLPIDRQFKSIAEQRE